MSTKDAIKALQSVCPDAVFLPHTPAYNELLQSYFSELNRDLKPACFVAPSSVSQVSAAVKSLKPFSATAKIAICGAGQQATPGVATVHDGITIHLRNLKGVEVDEEKKVVSVAAGEKMGAVYEKAMAAGLGVVGNRHSSGGIGGDALQNGLSYFSYARGLVCDNVVNFEVVLASGDVVNANANDNKDLWVALKGGGNNFGIVTRFDLQAFDQGQLWGGKVFYFQPSFPSQISALVEYLHNPEADRDVHICVSLGYAPALGDVMCMNDIFSLKPEKPKALDPFADIEPQVDQMKTLRTGTLKEFTDEAFSGAAANRVIKMTTTVKANASILEYALKIYNEFLQELKGTENLLYSLTFEPLPVSLMEQSISRGGNAPGLNPADGPLVVVLIYASWDKSSDDDKVFNINKKALESIETEAKNKNVSSEYRYLNYALPQQDPLSGYGEERRRFLQDVSRTYDTEGFFQKAVVGSKLNL